ncbi:hypothetical protein [Microbacterium sp. BH-3-3-3]|uniref:hypothetical protein n=1 Tax=Microbacterium sp. BH-3-3-3 TaxID=1906742 RepID=UPI000892904E|nr:hypothetical protein [Microbacterium sp. BH-3-3-3]AOX44409.1 hypothetical protein BJP65_00175 [Microbacterium sp. BH-3-3-3]
MTDNFRSELNAELHDKASGWRELDHMVAYLKRLLVIPDTNISVSAFRLSDVDGSTLSRTTTAEVQDALRLNHLKPDRVSVSISAVAPDSRARQEKIRTKVWLRFTAEGTPRQLDVDIESSEKLLLMGVKSQVQQELDQIDEWVSTAPEHTPVPASQTNYFHGPVNVGAIGSGNQITTGDFSSMSTESPVQPAASWWKQTWRDHTMAFVIAVGSGLLVAILGAVWAANGWTLGAANTELHLDDVTWTDGTVFEATGTVQHLHEDDEVWAFSQATDGFSGVTPRGQCEVSGSDWICRAKLGTDEQSGLSFVITAAVLTRKSANEIRTTPKNRLVSYPDADWIPKIDTPGAIDDITTWQP